MERKDFDWKQFIKGTAVIALPVAFQNLLSTTASMIDTIMLASLGEKAIGAVGLCSQFSTLMFSCYWGFVGGGMLFFSQYWGANDKKGITKSYGVTLSFMMAVAVIFAVMAIAFPYSVMSIYTDNENIKAIGIEYLQIVGIAYPLQVFAMAMSALLRSTERVKIPLYGAIASVISNCVFNYLFIFGEFGFPKLGVRGAAVGTVIAAVMNVLVIAVEVILKKIPFVFEIRQHFCWTSEFLHLYLRKCFPILCDEIMVGVGNMMINIVLGRQTEQAIAAVAVFRTLEGMVIAFFSGFSNAASVLVGKEVGAGNHEMAYQRAKRLVYMCSGMVEAICLILLAVHVPLFNVMGLSGESFEICLGMLIIYCIVSPLRLGTWCHNDTFRTGGDAMFGSVLEIIFLFLMVIPCVYIANFGIHAAFLVVFSLCYIDDPFKYIIMQRHMYSMKWIKPVSNEGMKTIGEFRKRHGIAIKKNDKIT
jgi:putative MATE family efflux protein